MDRRILEDHLRQAKQHAWVGLQHIRRQREIVEELERDGHDATMARTLLKTYEGTQKMHEADVQRLTKELAEL